MSKKKDKKIEESEIEINEDEKKEKEGEDNNGEIETKTAEKNDENDITELNEKIKKLEDTLLRKVAEFENFKRRTENDQLNLLKYSAESFILKILPVYDDLSRSVNHIEESDTDSFRQGLKLVYDKFTKVLDEQGVKKLDVKGKEFDVEYHEALMQQPSNEAPSNTVLDEVESGYIYKDKVIRHAKVIVSQALHESDEENNESKNDNEEQEK
jgi:molecular chaperone GrpE